MIVLDEHLADHALGAQIAVWYLGRVLSVRELRPGTVIKDEAMTTLLRTAVEPTFVTINVSDFWQKVRANPRFAIVCIDLPALQVLEIPSYLRRFLNLPRFKTKAARMGVVALLRPTRIEVYRANRKIEILEWNT